MKYSRRNFFQTAAGTVLVGLTSARVKPQTLRSAQPAVSVGVRRDVNTLSSNSDILMAYRDGVQAMRDLDQSDPGNPISWTSQASIHRDTCPHGNWFFLPWHRAYLYYFESIIRDLSGFDAFKLPYWDWTRNPQIPSTFWGSGNPLSHNRSATGSTNMPAEFVGLNVIQEVMANQDFEDFASYKSSAPRGGSGGGSAQLESAPHNRVHGRIGGDMGTYMSPLDPIFWLHHANVDRIWASWNEAGNMNSSDPDLTDFVLAGNFFDSDGDPVDVTVLDTYATTQLGYRYDRYESGPRASSPENLTFRQDESFSQPIRRAASTGLPLSTNVAFSDAGLAFLGQVAASSLLRFEGGPTVAVPRQKEKAILRIDGLVPPGDPEATVRIFLNCPYLEETTPLNDPHYLTSIAFFHDPSAGPDEHPHNSYVFDISRTLDALQRSGRFPRNGIEPQLLLMSNSSDETLRIDGSMSVSLLSAA